MLREKAFDNRLSHLCRSLLFRLIGAMALRDWVSYLDGLKDERLCLSCWLDVLKRKRWLTRTVEF